MNPSRDFEDWREQIRGQLIGVDIEGSPQGFRGSFSQRPAGRSRLAEVTATSMEKVQRREDKIDSGENAAFLINIVVNGRVSATQGSNHFMMEKGDLFLQNTTHPYHLEFPSASFHQLLTLRVPGDLMLSYMKPSDALCSIPLLRAGAAAVIGASIIRSLHENVAHIAEDDAELAVGAALTMIGAACATLIAPTRSVTSATFSRITRMIDNNLGRPELSPKTVAESAGINTRQLNRIFEAENETVSRFIMKRRLQHCRLDLLSAGLAGRSISEIAFNWGFRNLSHFSEAFRRTYNASPRELRRDRFVRV